ISTRAREQVLAAQQAMLDAGGTALVEARALAPDTGLVSPGLIDVSGSEVSDDEVFGPLLQVRRYDDFAAAIDGANATRYGLSAGLIGDDATRHELFSQRIRAGIVNWNRPITGASSAAPFGGVGASGNH